MICEIANKLSDYIDWIYSGDRVKNHYPEYSLSEVIIVIILAILVTLGLWFIIPLRIIFKLTDKIKFKCGKRKW